MKITINKKEEKQKPINWQKLPTGTVIEFDDKVRAVVFSSVIKCKLLLLTYSDGGDWFELADDYEDYTVVKVLGTISEIVVDE